jgi:hypothetical protein
MRFAVAPPGAPSVPEPKNRKGEEVRIRQIATAVVILATVAIATPAHANVGAACSAWKTTKTGGHQSACYVRSADWQVAAKGRGSYDGSTKLVQMNIAVSLQSSVDGISWTTIVSRSCGFTDVPSSSPGGSCLTAAQWVDAGTLYRARTFLVLFEANGTVRTTNPSYSPLTS